MYISNLSIRNFRTFKNVSLNFNKGVNTIIGENGAGKTNLFYALRLLIDESLPRGTKFDKNDFNRSLGSRLGHWIIIQVLFNELDPSNEAQSIAMHRIGDVSEVDSTIGSYCLYFRPREPFRRQLYEYSITDDKDQNGLNAILDTLTLNDYELVFYGKGCINFSIDANYKTYVGDFENITFPNPDNEQADAYGVKIRSFSIPNEVSCTFAKALRDVEADLRSYKDNPLLNLLRGKESVIPPATKTDIQNKVNVLNNDLSSLDEVKKVSEGISKTIKESVGETYAPGIKIQSELPSEIDKLLQSLKLLVGDPDEPDYQGKVWELSLGGANLIYISLKLLEYERVKATNKIANFILIEEPEAHLHTHIQKTLFQKLTHHNTQVIITTHSTHISSVSQISSMNVLTRSKKEAIAFNPSVGLSPTEVMHIERYLDAVRTNLLFAKGVLLVEGDAEQILIPELIKNIFGVTLDEIGVTLVNIGSTGFENIARLFHDSRIKKKCAIITDHDLSIVSLPVDPASDDSYQKDCRNSQKSGEERKQRLDVFISDNQWIKYFLAQHTFEIDLLLSNNSELFKAYVNKEYSRPADRTRINDLLSNPDKSISGREVIRLAKSEGKGWFALKLSDHLSHHTSLPDYLLHSLVFAAPHLNDSTLLAMINYRLKKLAQSPKEGDTTDYNAIKESVKQKENTPDAIDHFRQQLTSDILTKLLNLVRPHA